MIAVDTNVIVRHAIGDDPRQTTAARAFMRGLTPTNPGFVGLVVLVELYWVLRRSHGIPPEQIHAFVESMLDAPELEVEDEESVDRALHAARGGADFADALIDETAELYGCTETVTFDRRAADRLGWRLLTTR